MTKLETDMQVIENTNYFFNIKKGRKTIVKTCIRRHGVITEVNGTKLTIWLSDGEVIQDKMIYWSKMW